MSPATVDVICHAAGNSHRITRTAIVRTREEYIVRAYGPSGRIPAADYFSGGTSADHLRDCEATADIMVRGF